MARWLGGPAFPLKRSLINGYVKGYKRRFWQGSTDHRGVPGAPGRVVTLVPMHEWEGLPDEEEAVIEEGTPPEPVTWGVAFYVSEEKKEEVLSYLDVREKGGYSRELVDVYTIESGDSPAITGVLLYRATRDNPEFLGPSPLREMAEQIHRSVGPSGKNVEYLLNLAKAMREMGVSDPHLIALEKHVLELASADSKLLLGDSS
ncbi:Cation transport regulator-like protein 2, variant 2 [Balamuthia mandrillaris]